MIQLNSKVHFVYSIGETKHTENQIKNKHGKLHPSVKNDWTKISTPMTLYVSMLIIRHLTPS